MSYDKRDVLYFFSDLHLTNKNSKFKKEDGVSDLLKAQSEFCHDLLIDANREGDLTHIVFTGDWSDYTNFDPIMQQFSNECFKKVCGLNDVENIFVGGNHTVYGSQNSYSVLGATEELVKNPVHNAVHVIDSVQSTIVGADSDHKIQFFVVPYQEDYEKIVSQISLRNEKLGDLDYGDDVINILTFHFPTLGAKLDNKYESETGVPLEYEYVDNFDLCLGGDFHRPQQVFPNFYYVGAPFSLKFGENDCHRGYVKVIVEDGEIELERVKNEHNYQMMRVEGYDGFTDLVMNESHDWERMILKVEGEITEEERVQIKKADQNFYRLIFPPIGKASSEEEESVEVDVNKMEVFGENEDLKQLKNTIDDLDISSDLKSEALSLFRESVSS